jgi:hypothetical protein
MVGCDRMMMGMMTCPSSDHCGRVNRRWSLYGDRLQNVVVITIAISVRASIIIIITSIIRNDGSNRKLMYL